MNQSIDEGTAGVDEGTDGHLVKQLYVDEGTDGHLAKSVKLRVAIQ